MDAAKRSQSRMDRSSLRVESPRLIGTALCGAVCRVVWDRGVNYSPGPDSASDSLVLLSMELSAFSPTAESLSRTDWGMK